MFVSVYASNRRRPARRDGRLGVAEGGRRWSANSIFFFTAVIAAIAFVVIIGGRA